MAIRYFPSAETALRRHRNMAGRIIAKIEAYAENPGSFPQVKQLQGQPEKRLRVGDFRVLFREEDGDLLVIDIGPRGSIYD